MEPRVWGSAAVPVRVAMDELCQLLDSIEQTTDLFERHTLFRRLSATTHQLSALRLRGLIGEAALSLA